jgi:hypothetical protein
MKRSAIALWAHPRSLSTAFERMILQRGDFYVLHEPFCTFYDTGSVEIVSPEGSVLRLDSFDAIADCIIGWSGRTNVFLKETLEYRYEVLFRRTDLLGTFTHTFLIREPEKTINSYYAMKPNFSFGELGYGNLLDLYDVLDKEKIDVADIIDADELLQDPVGVISNYCIRTGISFDPASLSWKPGENELWRRTQKWHEGVSNSAGFTAAGQQYSVTVQNHAGLREYYEKSLPLYEKLKSLIPSTYAFDKRSV